MRKLILLSIFFIFGAKKGFNQVQQTLSSGQPLVFTSLGNDTYNKSVLYHDLSKGFFIDLAKTSNNINSNPIDFKINARGGLNHFFTLKGENGNVGIGTSSPKSKLHVFGQVNGNFNGLVIDNRKNYGTNSGTNETSRILLALSENGTPNPLNRIFGIVEAGTVSETDSSNGRLSFYTRKNGNTEEKVRITHEGNVGIGTINPGIWKLAVNGQIRAKEIKVETGWSDFVFENDYRLPTLREVEKHIKEKGHLKDIPSAKEVEKNGIFLGEMNSKLLQKIEELTLYTISQEKKINNLEKDNESLKTMNSKLIELQKRLEKLEKK